MMSLAETVHRFALVIDAFGALGFAISGVFLLGATTSVLLRGCGWLLVGVALVFFSRFGLGLFDLERIYATGIGDLFRLFVVVLAWAFVVRHVIWFPYED